MLDVVEFSELATIVWGDVLLELLERLTAEVSPIDEKKYMAGIGELDEPVDGSNSSNRTPVSVAPSFLASMTPAAAPSIYSK